MYGTKNLRVIDASVPPLSVSAHLMSVVYGLAEIGSEIVLQQKGKYDKKVVNSSGGKGGGSGKGDGASKSGGSDKSDSKNDDSDSKSGAVRTLLSPAAVVVAIGTIAFAMI